MKILYAFESTRQFFYHDLLILKLAADGHIIDLKFVKDEYNKKSINSVKKVINKYQNIKSGYLIERKGILWRIILIIRDILTVSNYLNQTGQSPYYLQRWENYLGIGKYLIRLSLIKKIIKSSIFVKIFNFIDSVYPSDQSIRKYLITDQIDIVIATPGNKHYSQEIEYIKAAKKIGLLTVIPVISWDNLTTKGLFHARPDLLLVWNKTQKKEAIQYHKISPATIKITGSLFFDKWLIDDYKGLNKKIYSDLKLQENNYLVYLGSSENIVSNESEIITNIMHKLSLKKELINLKIVVKPHPSNFRNYLNIYKSGCILWPYYRFMPEDKKSRTDFYTLIKGSLAVIGINTSAMIDSIILNKPCIAYISKDMELTQRKTVHFKYLYESSSIEIADNYQNLINIITNLKKGKDKFEKNRRMLIQTMIRPWGIKKNAYDVAAKEIYKAYEKNQN